MRIEYEGGLAAAVALNLFLILPVALSGIGVASAEDGDPGIGVAMLLGALTVSAVLFASCYEVCRRCAGCGSLEGRPHSPDCAHEPEAARAAREAAERARARTRAAGDALVELRRGCLRDGYDEAGVARIDEATDQLLRGSLTAAEAEQAVDAARRRAETRERLEWLWDRAVRAPAFDAIAFLQIRKRLHRGTLDEEEAEREASLIAERAVGSAVRGGLRRVK